MMVPTMMPRMALPSSAAPAPVSNSQNTRLRSAELVGREHLGVGQAGRETRAHRRGVGAGREAHREIVRLAGGHAEKRAAALERGEHLRRGGERADAAGDRDDARLLIADLGGRAEPGDAELREIRAVDRDRVGHRQVVGAALDHVPRTQAGAPAGDPTRKTGIEAPPFGLRHDA